MARYRVARWALLALTALFALLYLADAAASLLVRRWPSQAQEITPLLSVFLTLLIGNETGGPGEGEDRAPRRRRRRRPRQRRRPHRPPTRDEGDAEPDPPATRRDNGE